MSAGQRSNWLPVLAMLGCSLISYIDRQALAVLSPTILAETGMSVRDYTVVVGFFSAFYMLGNPVWGYVLDRVGLRGGMTASVGLWSAASAAHGLLTGFWGFAAARALLGFGEGATFPGGLRTAADSLPLERRSRGVAVAYSGGSLGALITPVLVTPIAMAWGWRAAFLLTGLLGLLWLVLWRVVSRPERLPVTVRPHGPPPLPNPRDPRLWALICSYALGAFPLSYVLYIAPIYLSKVLGFSQADLGRVLWIPPLGWETGYFFWGWVADRFATGQRPTRLFALLAAASLVLPLAAGSRSPAVVLALMFFSMFVAAGFIVLSLRAGTMAYPREQTAMVAGIGAGSWSALVALVLPALGGLFDRGMHTESFLLVSLFPVAGTAGWWFFSRRPSRA